MFAYMHKCMNTYGNEDDGMNILQHANYGEITAGYIKALMISPALRHPSSPLAPVSSVLSASKRKAWTRWLWDGTQTCTDTGMEAHVLPRVS